MQPQDQPISRRALDVEDYIDILRRHKSWILGPMFASLVIGTVIACLWPNTYVSSGLVRVVPPKVPESFVPSNLNSDLQARFESMYGKVVGKDNLTSIVNEYDLYKKERKNTPLQDLVEQMKTKYVKFSLEQAMSQSNGKASLPAFRIGFASDSPKNAQRVTERLISDLIKQNQSATSDVTVQTTEFIKKNWEVSKKKLDEIEGRLSTFRQRNLNNLPEQQQANYTQLANLQTQMLNLNAAMSRVTQEKLMNESQVRIWREQLAQLKDPSSQESVAAAPKNEKLIEKDREINYFEAALASARERYKESHPDVQTMIAKVAAAKRQREELAKEEAGKKPEQIQRPANSEMLGKQRDLEAAIKQRQSVMEAKDIEMQDYEKSVASVRDNLRKIQGSMEGMPVGLKEYEELMRDRDLAKKDYEELDKTRQRSEMATQVIKAGQGETLEILELANLPETPTEPKRPLIVLASTGVGLILGLFFAGAREVKDTSLKNLKDVRAYTQLPILGSIPLLENDLIVRRRRRLSWLAWATAGLLGMIVISTSIVYYYTTKV